MADRRPPSGDRIAAEIEQEMEERLYPLRNVTLAPAEYHVYLHPDDFSYIEGVVPRIVEDVQTCLNTLVQRLNQRSMWSRVTDLQRRAPIEVPAGGWAVYIKPSANDDVDRGEIGIHSRLSVPAGARFGSGAGTVRISETLVTGAERKTRMRTEAIPPPAGLTPPHDQSHPEQSRGVTRPAPQALVPAPPALAEAGTAPAPQASVSPAQSEVAPPPLPRPVVLSGSRLLYRDDSGEHVYPICKDLTKIGRGGAEHWVDVMVTAGAQVSREHCRIRRDASGRLFLQDVSTWGTFLDGTQVEKFEERSGREHELSHGSSIRLADAVTLELLLR